MADPKRLFRKAALDRLSSPEQLDVVMEVTPPRAWLALGATGVLILTLIVWSILGSIPETVVAQGILLRRGGIFDVPATAQGQVAEVAVVEGDEVEAGQVVARVAQPDLVTQINNARLQLAEFEAQQQQLVGVTTRELALRQEALELQRAKLIDTESFLKGQIEALAEQLENTEELQRKGLVTKQNVLQTRQSYFATQDNLQAARNELQQTEVNRLAFQAEKEGSLESSRLRVNDIRRQLGRLEDQLKQASVVTSPYSGRVLEVKADPGDMVGPGVALLSLQFSDQETEGLQALLYAPPASGKQIRAGMQVQVSPSMAKREEFGFLIAKVRHVSEFPATREGMTRVLANPGLVASLSGEGAPFAVYADLIRDPGSASGFQWSSSKGNPLKVSSGTLCAATIVVRERRPIGMVIPLFREYTGL